MRENNSTGVDINEFFDELMAKDDDFRTEWQNYQPEYEAMRALIKARIDKHLTQKELSVLTGIDQSDISKIERGVRNPTIKLLQKIANALDMDIRIEFVPKRQL